MTGMKEGAGEDPFADDDQDTASDEQQSQTSSHDSALAQEPEPRAEETTEQQAQGGVSRTVQIPYKFRRDGVQDGRDRVPLFLHEETKTRERNALRELEDQLDENVSLTDLREAVVMVGLEHLDEVRGNLEEWGYGMTFE